MFSAIADYGPPEGQGDALPLKEGDLVDVVDGQNPDLWLCRDAAHPSKQGWVPPGYLLPKGEEKIDKRTTQEVFREDVIKIDNEKQEAVMRRRFVNSHYLDCYLIV